VNAAIAVSDASPLISFPQIGRLDLLRAQFSQVMVPSAVELEVLPSVGTLPAWIDKRHAPLPADFLSQLDGGEREAIALAAEVDASYLIIDDLPGRRAALRLGLRVIGSLGLLARAKRRGLIGEVRPLMDAMITHGLYAGEGLYRHVLSLAGEGE
jgi:predicted nucleic acid-binding protein